MTGTLLLREANDEIERLLSFLTASDPYATNRENNRRENALC
jgi:hypothetical protein